eukprot:CAMPEP_0116123570 /NCGR_PEP_ID=MMETSP0329-20121206/4818_1 /TAXON_ID=697910 /ORGANISM="Pseudo-nitzschia arenysensis, Strain B593" /LENGTH=293 /DNA_ID=CAMNT_0003617493 /DNA_START=72 /DNA_END=953 /DNA_ORIENTATION=+
MPAAFDFSVVHPRGENEKHIGESIIDDIFAKPTKSPIRVQWEIKERWGKSGDLQSPAVIKIEKVSHSGGGPRETGLELRRCARRYQRPMELVYRDPVSKQDTLLAVVGTVPITSSTTTDTTIYSPDPSFQGQIPISNGGSAGARNIPSTYYPRATIKMSKKNKSAYFEYATTIKMIENDSENKVERSIDTSNDETSTVYTSEEVPGPTGPQTIIRKKGRETSVSSSSADAVASILLSSPPFSNVQSLNMTIAPGIDPCLMICIASDMMNRMAMSEKSSVEECLDCCCSAFLGC